MNVPSPYTSGFSLKQSCIALNLSTQSIPLGSCSENTKQENASRNCMPHGPCAIPPRHGQSQLIFPVTGSNAPPDDSEDPSSPPSSEGAAPSAFSSSTRSAAAAWDSEVSEGGSESGSVSEDWVDSNACVVAAGFGLAKKDVPVKRAKGEVRNQSYAHYQSRGQSLCSLDLYANLGTRPQ